MRDRIEINGLTVTTVVGALPHEREIAQPLRVDLALEIDLHDAGCSDDLGDTVHYGDVTDRIAAIVRDNKDVLLERLADRIAEVAVGFTRVEAVELTVTKLRPPIGEHVDTTAVRIRRTPADFDLSPATTHRAIVAFGSNLGDRERYLRFALGELGGVVDQSQVFETDPVGGPSGQGAYLNLVATLETALDPFAFVRRCQRVEAAALRQRTVQWGPRTLDIDVLFYDDVTISSPELTIPHPRYAERGFVLAPLSEVAPEHCPPGWESTVGTEGVHARGRLV